MLTYWNEYPLKFEYSRKSKSVESRHCMSTHVLLGGFLGDKDALTAWIQEKANNWAEAVKELASATKYYPKTAYYLF
jgi:hypothetical protein